MDSAKLNPQPDPPNGIFSIFNWLWYIVQYVFWAVLYPFRYFA
jgi:hypothetical protein